MTDSAVNKHSKTDDVALNAILSVRDGKSLNAEDFATQLDQNRLTPVGRVQGYPIYRLIDFENKNHCYLLNERSILEDKPSTVEFGVLDEYLLVSGTYGDRKEESETYLLSLEIINHVLTDLHGSKLTPMELRLTAQILAGMTLKKAAETDNVSIETKRSQMKVVIGKLNIERQIDVVRVLLPELLFLTDVNSWDNQGQRLFNQYANNFLPDRVRCNRIVDKTSREVRIIDFGPLSGKPVVILHSMIFPDITNDDVDFAFKHNLRLIWPLRPGILNPSPNPKSVELYSKETIEGIELVWENFCNAPVPVIAMVSSAWHATEFAAQNPEKVSDISFAATCFSAGKFENNLVYFGSSVAELCSRNTWLMSKTVDFVQKRATELPVFEKTIRRVFNNSNADSEVLNQEFDAPFYGERLKMAIIDSPESIKHDYFNQVHFSWSSVKSLKMPVKFIHGSQDSLHKISDLYRLNKSIGSLPLTTMKDSGHIMQYNHFSLLLQEALGLDVNIKYT